MRPCEAAAADKQKQPRKSTTLNWPSCDEVVGRVVPPLVLENDWKELIAHVTVGSSKPFPTKQLERCVVLVLERQNHLMSAFLLQINVSFCFSFLQSSSKLVQKAKVNNNTYVLAAESLFFFFLSLSPPGYSARDGGQSATQQHRSSVLKSSPWRLKPPHAKQPSVCRRLSAHNG